MSKHEAARLHAREIPEGSADFPRDAMPQRTVGLADLFSRCWPWLAAALSGWLLALSFPPWNFGWVAWIALVPLICAVWFSSPRRPRRSALLGYLSGIIFFAVTFSWLGTLGELFEQRWLHLLPLILSLYLGLYFAFWSWFISIIPRWPLLTPNRPVQPRPAFADAEIISPFRNSAGNLWIAGVGAAAWVAHEWVRGWLFSGFGWNGLGVALHNNVPMIQIANLAGVAGLSFLVAFCNLMLVIIVARIRAELGPVFLKRVRWEFSLAVAIVVAVFAYGEWTLLRGQHSPYRPLRVSAVQPNIPQHEKFSPASEERIFERLNKLTALAASTQPDLVIWPEAATHRGIYSDESNYRFVQTQASRGDFAFLLGTVESDLASGKEYNVALLLTDRGENIQPYRKMHLVPFGEYLPFRESFPIFAMIAGELVPGDFSAGTEFKVMQLPESEICLAALICFEDSLGNLTRRFVQNGASLLVNLTNDGWFLKSPAAEQHLANALFRAIENRRPLVRCANTGVTCAIDVFGRVDRWLPPFERGFVTREIRVPQTASHTFYTRWGDWFSMVALAVTVAAIARFIIAARQRRIS